MRSDRSWLPRGGAVWRSAESGCVPVPRGTARPMKHTPFKDRAEAGRLLAERLSGYRGREDLVVLALPRGGVPVAFEIARELDGPLDVFLVRKLGVPGREELALGAIASGAIRVLNTQLVDALEITTEQIEAIAARELQELERRERAYRGDRPAPDVSGRTVILVDDGLATGATMSAAVLAVRQDEPASVVMAVPVGDPDVCASFREYADEVVCLRTPQPLRGVGAWYEDFSQTTDDEVRELLARARRPRERRQPPSNLTPLTGAGDDYDGLVQRAASARYALLGEASHGTHDFYVARAEITKRLIVEHGFDIVAVEADWPDAYRVNRFVRGTGDDDNAEEALGDFCRFPVWMWRNTDVAEFVAWLRAHNDALPAGAPKVGFYGLDLYSLYTSIDAVVSYLEEIDPAAAQRARERYACFGHFGRDPQVYAHEAGIGGAEPCERQAVEQLAELRSLAAGAALSNGCLDDDRQFYAEQNARLVVDAEQHYRAVFRGGHESWNLRDRHMVETLEALVADIERRRAGTARAVVWEHNSHVGDARRRCVHRRLHHVHRHRHRRLGLGRGRRAQARAPRATRKLGRDPARAGRPGVHHRRRRAGGTRAGARDRRRLPAGDRAPVALPQRAYGNAVRCRHPSRRDARGGAARTLERVGAR